MEKKTNDQESENVKSYSREEIEHFPQIETYEEFRQENGLLEHFVEQIAKNAPSGEIDIYSREFWDYYQKYVEQMWQEKYLPMVDGIPEKYHPQPVKDFVFSGDTKCFRSNEHVARMKLRTVLNMIQKELGFDDKTLLLIQKGQPLYYRLDGGYGPKNVSDKVLETYWAEMKDARDALIKHPDFEKLSALNKQMITLNSLYLDVGHSFMYGNFPSAKEIKKQHNSTYDTSMLREMADTLNEEFPIQDLESHLTSQDEKDFFSAHSGILKKIVQGACEQAFIYNASPTVSKVLGDANGYSSCRLFLNPETEKGKERLLWSNKL